MESLLGAVVHENSNRRVRLEGLEVRNEINAPIAADDVIVPPVQHHVSLSAQKNRKLPKPPVRQMPTVQSD